MAPFYLLLSFLLTHRDETAEVGKTIKFREALLTVKPPRTELMKPSD